MTKTSEYALTPRDVEVLKKATEHAAHPFADTIGIFMEECRSGGLSPKVSGAGLSMFILTNLATTLMVCSGYPLDEVPDDEMSDIGFQAQAHMAKAVSAFIEERNAKDVADTN